MFRTKVVEEITATMAARMRLIVTFTYIACLFLLMAFSFFSIEHFPLNLRDKTN